MQQYVVTFPIFYLVLSLSELFYVYFIYFLILKVYF